ncbi:MAG: hypothetical protein LUH07_13760 [Lachnospiraceae bacterium]|nr:hypothetical protein [Lachnospiraceae bacterium]
MKGNKAYGKPDFMIMQFVSSDNFADSACDYYNPVTIPCLITESHTIFYSNCGTGNDYNYLGSSIVEVESTLYFSSAMQAVEYLSGKSVESHTSSSSQFSYELKAGEYLVWTSGQTHAALITTNVSSGINASA